MKIGLENKLIGNTSKLSSTPDADTGFPNINIIDSDTKEIWQTTGSNIVFTMTFAPTTFDLICLFNVEFVGQLTLKTYDVAGGTATNTVEFTDTDLKGLQYKYLSSEMTDKTTRVTYIEISISNSAAYSQGFIFNSIVYNSYTYGTTFYVDSPASIGYIWAGDVVDFGCLEAIQSSDISTDDVRIGRANNPDSQERFDYEQHDITIGKNDNLTLDILKTKMRSILYTGYGTPRPFFFDTEPFLAGETVFAILDSGKISYDRIDLNGSGDNLAQATLGIREVF